MRGGVPMTKRPIITMKELLERLMEKSKTQNSLIKTHVKFKFYHSIGFKFLLAFLLPVLAVIMIGIISYHKSSKAIINSYKDNGFQSLIMTSDFSTFGLETSEATAFQYIVDDNFKNYFNGLYKNDLRKENSISSNLSKAIMAKETSDEFISGVHLLSDGKKVIGTHAKGNSKEINAYQSFLESEGGKQLASDSKASYWIGDDRFLRTVDSNTDYAIRYVKGFQTSKACIIVDISAKQIESMLKRLDYGDDSIVGFVTEDNKEVILSKDADIQNTSQIFSFTQFYQVARADKETLSGKVNVKFNGNNYLFLYSILDGSKAMICALIPEKNILNRVLIKV